MNDLEAALNEAIAATGVERYRHLCSDVNTLPPPNSPADWRRFILEGRWRPGPQSVDVGLVGQPTTPVKVDYAVSPAKPCGGC